MSPEQYKSHLATLGLTQAQAAAWLGVSVRTQRRYEKNGPEGPAARAVGLAAGLSGVQRVYVNNHNRLTDILTPNPAGRYVEWSDIAPLLAVKEGE